ncbi:MAG: Asp-tRNA(Asn)/Glu-tRNA(Gln) amidotransferase subunit GatB [Bacteroidetes bacterium]|nr:Asp-tRNA(Asn)/Glu-tRNA(Gln) amidotransferase subunit GatB [Bacteroidota bacterium]
MSSPPYVTVVGLEVHIQLLTRSKIFSGDANRYGDKPNTNLGVITLAHPGTLPKFNRRVLEHAVRLGIACGSEISMHQVFDRKNYFYPDLPKGYQLTQDKTPVCRGGQIRIVLKDGASRMISLHKIHMEEDAGKSMHLEGRNESAVDYNRAGVPLLELVTHPVLHSGEEAALFLSEVRKLVQFLGICDGNMEEGSLRCDANVSVMPEGSRVLGKKVEIKNMNSIRHVQRAVDYEAARQTEILSQGGEIISETRTYHEEHGKTSSMRMKEELNDYRYFPDPDLTPLALTKDWIDEIRKSMPALPNVLREKFITEYGLPAYDAGVLTETREMASYFEALCKETRHYKSASNWLMGPVKSLMNEHQLTSFDVSPARMAALISMVEEGQVSFTAASQKLFPELVRTEEVPMDIAVRLDLLQNRDGDAIEHLVKEVIHEFPLKVEEYRSGKKGIVSMLMGEVMKRGKGKLDPRLANECVIRKLNES